MNTQNDSFPSVAAKAVANPEKGNVRPGASKRHAFLVGAGIFLSRIAGLIRERIFAHYFGNSDAADAFKAAFRIPNFFQNLFGEGVLSASFIPVYAGLLAREDDEEARRTAGAVASLLALATSMLVVTGVLATPYLIDAIAPGFHGDKRELTIRLVRILFPGAGLLVFSAWCLGILNSHRKFFVSYTAPVIWNAAMIATLWGFGGRYPQYPLAAIVGVGIGGGQRTAGGGAVANGAAAAARAASFPGLRDRECKDRRPQFCSGFLRARRGADQRLRGRVARKLAGHRRSFRILLRADSFYAAGESIWHVGFSGRAAAHVGGDREREGNRRSIARAARSGAAADCVLCGAVGGGVPGSGRRDRGGGLPIGEIHAERCGLRVGNPGGSHGGLAASTLGRLYSSAYYALRDTRTPLRFAIVRVVLTTILGYLCAIPLPRALGIETRWGAVGLTVSAGIASWVEFTLLRRTLNRRIGHTGISRSYLAKLWAAAIAAAAVGWAIRHFFGHHGPIALAWIVLLPYGGVYLGMAAMLGVGETQYIMRRLRSR